MKIKNGDRVRFLSKVFEPPYTPHYDAYKGHEFLVLSQPYKRTHLELICVTDIDLKVQGYVHTDEVEVIDGAIEG